MNDDRISRRISYLLRHEKGYTRFDGFVDVTKLLNDIDINFDDLKRIVENDNKQRYSFSKDFSMIRANQGHSTGVDVGLTECVPPSVLYHGTADRFLDSIMKDGIKSMTRDYVHLSYDRKTASVVGKRHGVPVVLSVDAEKMYNDGISFFISENHVWLTRFVDKKYVRRL